MQSIHYGDEHSCVQCDYKATQKGHLQIYVQLIHDGVKHSCEQCDYKATKNKISFDIHSLSIM